MIELFVQIDNRPLSRWGCDGVICATPTGSTAYAFSAGGPIVWPDVPAFSLLPIAAHALFSKPLVVSDQSIIQIEVESASALLSADGLRNFELQAGDRVKMSRDAKQIQLSHMENAVFTDRLVAKFKLPIEGWRGH
jgi:NAD+ kinase